MRTLSPASPPPPRGRLGRASGCSEVDEFALPELLGRLQPRALCLGNLFRDQLDRYGELELVAERWRGAVAELPEGSQLVFNADDPQLAVIGTARAGSVAFGVDDPRVARGAPPHAALKYCLTCGAPLDYAAAYVGHLGDYSCPNGHQRRPPLDVAARDIELAGLERAAFLLVTPEGSRRVELSLPGLYNVYNALAAAALSCAVGASLDEIAAGLARFSAAFGRFERIAVGDKRILVLLIKNPAGANEAVRTLVDGGSPRVLVAALNDEIADGRDVSWIWDVDFEPLLPPRDSCRERRSCRGARAALPVRRARRRLAVDVRPALDVALDRGPGGPDACGRRVLVVLPTYTAMLGLQRIGILTSRGLTKAYWS